MTVGTETAGPAVAKISILPPGVKVVAVAADVSNPADAARVVKAAFDELGRVDILVTNSGGPPSGREESIEARRQFRIDGSERGAPCGAPFLFVLTVFADAPARL